MSTVKKAVAAEINTIVEQTIKFKNLMNTAKTSYKKEFYQKKINRNNDKIIPLLQALDRLPSDTTDVSSNETDAETTSE